MSIAEIDYPNNRKGIKFLLSIRKQRLGFFLNIMRDGRGWLGYKIINDPVLLLADATAIQSIFQEKNSLYSRSKYVKNLKHLFSGGIFLSDGERWRQQRTEAAPVFANGNFPEMIEQMKLALESMLGKWNKKISAGEAVDLNADLTSYALDVALRSLFHLEREDLSEKIQENLGILLREAEQRIWALWSFPQSLIMRLPKYRRALLVLRAAVDDIIADRIKNPAYPDDLLSRAIRSYQNGENDYKVLQDKIVAYMTSAHETTANALVWAWYEISQRPEIFKNLRSEADRVLTDNRINIDSIKQLDYARQVFDETLRLYPSVWTMSREVSVDDVVPLDDGTYLSIPKGTTVMLSPYVVHRRECYWENPLAFDPSRFEREEILKRPKMAYFPFAGGARLCLGFRFAQIEAIIALSEIARRYDLSLIAGQDIRPEPNITLRPNRDVLFNIRHRGANKVVMTDNAAEVSVHEKPSSCPFHHRSVTSTLMETV